MSDEQIRQVLQQRNINKLFHFTNAENLANIFQCGLQTRETLELQSVNGAKVFFNDYSRYDGFKNSVSLSIEFPNYKMFYSRRCNSADNIFPNWAVLEINANVLCDYPCAFCKTNASDASVSCIAIEERMGAGALLRLFEDWEGKPTRNELGLKTCFPTNPQAEVLVFSEIPVAYFKSVSFENDEIASKYEALARSYNIQVRVNRDLFSPRSDYTHW